MDSWVWTVWRYVIRKMQDLAAESHSFILDMHQVNGHFGSAPPGLLNQAGSDFSDDGIAVVFSRIHNARQDFWDH